MAKKSLNMMEKMMDPNIIECYKNQLCNTIDNHNRKSLPSRFWQACMSVALGSSEGSLHTLLSCIEISDGAKILAHSVTVNHYYIPRTLTMETLPLTVKLHSSLYLKLTKLEVMVFTSVN